MGIITIDAAQNALRLGDGQQIRFANSFSCFTGISLGAVPGWATSTGFTVDGAVGGYPVSGGAPRILTNSTTGALIVRAPKTGSSLYTVGIEATLISGSIGTLHVFDRICDIRAPEGAAAFASGALDATSKISAEDFCQCMVETAVGLALGPPNWQPIFNYTNQNNVAKTSTYGFDNFNSNPNQLFPYNPAGTPFGPLLNPLAAGDMGMRTITSITISGSVAASPGDVVYCLVKPICSITLDVIGIPLSRDLVAQSLPIKLRNDPCLCLVYTHATSTDAVLHGEIKLLSA